MNLYSGNLLLPMTWGFHHLTLRLFPPRRKFPLMKRLPQFTAVLWLLSSLLLPIDAAEAARTVYIIPVHDNISTPMAYLVRRGIKQAMENDASAVILDMETNGGTLDSTEEIIKAL